MYKMHCFLVTIIHTFFHNYIIKFIFNFNMQPIVCIIFNTSYFMDSQPCFLSNALYSVYLKQSMPCIILIQFYALYCIHFISFLSNDCFQCISSYAFLFHKLYSMQFILCFQSMLFLLCISVYVCNPMHFILYVISMYFITCVLFSAFYSMR